MLLTKIVASLALIFGQSVLSLETGYKYQKAPASSADLHADLKCGCLFNGLTHLRLIRLLIKDKNTLLSTLVDQISYSHCRAMIHALNKIEGVRIGPLWTLHFFTSTTNTFYKHSMKNGDDQQQRELVIRTFAKNNTYVTGLLQDEVKNCRRGNAFNSYDRWYQWYNHTQNGDNNLRQIDQEIRRNYTVFGNMLRKNNMLPTDDPQYNALKVKELLMNNFGNNHTIQVDMMIVYNVQVHWRNTITLLQAAWVRVKEMKWYTNKQRDIKSYYELSFDFCKVVIIRLMWKHLLHVRYYTGSRRVTFVKQWYFLLMDFRNMLKLGHDPHIKYLLAAMDDLAEAQESIVNIIYCLEDILRTITPALNCVATDPMVLDGQEFKIHHRSMKQDQMSFFKDTSRPSPIERNSLANAKMFLAHLRVIFTNVDFGLIRLLLDYIDEINQ